MLDGPAAATAEPTVPAASQAAKMAPYAMRDAPAQKLDGRFWTVRTMNPGCAQSSIDAMLAQTPSLRYWRAQRVLSQRELADRAGVTRKVVVHLENGRQTNKLGTVRRLAEALGVRHGDLIDAPPGFDDSLVTPATRQWRYRHPASGLAASRPPSI